MLANEAITLLDVRGLALRAYHSASKENAVADNDGNEFPCASEAFSNFLDLIMVPILEQVAPRQVYVIWDGGNLRRQSIYPEYKKKRSTKEKNEVEAEEIRKFMNLCVDFFKAVGVRQCTFQGMEADDVIAYFCDKMLGPKIVYTLDGDLTVLAAQEDTQVVLKDDVITDMYKGVPLALVTAWKSIVGDSSDEYIGVRGIGEQGFLTLRDRYGWDGLAELAACVETGDFQPLEDAIAVTHDALLQKLYAGKEQWAQSWQLAKLHPEWCDQQRHLRMDLVFRVPSVARLQGLLERTGLNPMYEKFTSYMPSTSLVTAANDHEIENIKMWADWTPFMAFDYESWDPVKHPAFLEANKKFVDSLSQVPTGISFCFGQNLQYATYVTVGHKDTENCDPAVIPEVLGSLEERLPLIAHNAQFEYTLTAVNFGKHLRNLYDTRVSGSYADESAAQSLKQRALHDLRYEMTSYAETIGDRAGMHELTADEVLDYGCDDAIATAHLYDLHTTVMQLEGSYPFFIEYERAPGLVFARTFIEGTPIDFDALKQMGDEDMTVIKRGQKNIRSDLATHCPQPNEPGALQLFNEQWPITEAKMRKKGGDDIEEKLAKKKEELWGKCWYGTAYVPFTVRTLEVKFSPTLLQLSKVLDALGLTYSEPPGKQPVVKTISEWIVANRDEWSKTEDGAKFTDLLAKAAYALAKPKDRTGTDYEALHTFCAEVLARSGKQNVEKHGDELNFDSPKQMAELLYGKMALPVRVQNMVKKTSERAELDIDGSASASAQALRLALAHDCGPESWQRQVLQEVIAVRKAMQNHKLYYHPYPLWPHPKDGFIHPQLTDCGTVTRRPTGSSPNVLQVSKKDDAKIRKAYPAPAGMVNVALDFNGQELRLTASESRDPAMLEAYLSQPMRDIHSVTGSAILQAVVLSRFPHLASDFAQSFGYEEFMQLRSDPDRGSVANEARQVAKTVNFLMIYGGGYTTLAANLDIHPEMAKQIFDSTFARYARIRPWQGEVAVLAKTQGFVETVYGSRRHADARLWSADHSEVKRQERQMVNYLAQGTAADILKVVLTRIEETKLIERLQATAIKPVYDEISACVPIDNVQQYVAEMVEIMELTPPTHPVPMMAECSIGTTWGDMVELPDTTEASIEQALSALPLQKVA